MMQAVLSAIRSVPTWLNLESHLRGWGSISLVLLACTAVFAVLCCSSRRIRVPCFGGTASWPRRACLDILICLRLGCLWPSFLFGKGGCAGACGSGGWGPGVGDGQGWRFLPVPFRGTKQVHECERARERARDGVESSAGKVHVDLHMWHAILCLRRSHEHRQ